MLFHNRSARDLSEHFLVLPCPVIKVNGKPQLLNLGVMTKGTDLSGMKVRVTYPGKEPRPVEELAEGEGSTEWIVEEEYKYQIKPCVQLQE